MSINDKDEQNIEQHEHNHFHETNTVTISRRDYDRLKKAQRELIELKGVEKENQLLAGTLSALMFDSNKGKKQATERALMHSENMKDMRAEINHLALESRGEKNWMSKTIDMLTGKDRK